MAERTSIPRRARFISDERIGCPVRHTDTDVETCWRCPWLRDVGRSRQARYVVCEPPFASLPAVGLGPSVFQADPRGRAAR